MQLTTANDLAARRGSRVFSNNDLNFQIRHDSARVARLQNFLRWKSIRKSVRDDDDKGSSELAIAEAVTENAGNGPMPPDATTRNTGLPAVILPWDIRFLLSEQRPGGDDDEDLHAESNEATLDKLRRADEKTKKMTAEEYVTFSEYRHASFTWRKVKRFREWSGLGVIADHKPTDDSLDILGFLTSEMVQRLTVIALLIQQQEVGGCQCLKGKSVFSTDDKREGLFTSPNPKRPPIDTRHIRQAFHVTQTRAERRRVKLYRPPARKTLWLI
ncbi:hypothetical protein QL093DRAFT_2446514 [Fusarium oxysporum]|nr:hypothetical protein QL093DRAFT_2446514 [Fusarium oxysporum]